jgi:glyoxylase-like metal-dependent hydrolase (beta-lactamase superfamily II)
VVTALGGVGASFRAFGSSGRVTMSLRDGDELTLRDRTLQVRHRPGHSPTDTVFADAARGILIAGDHLLSKVSSNPLISRRLPAPGDPAPAPAGKRPQALLEYIASLQRTREMQVEIVLGGHGPPVSDHAKLIDERLRMHERRAAKLHRMLAAGPQTAYDLASQMWGNVAVTQAFLTISEVLGHLDLLKERGEIAEDETDGEVTRFSVT